MKKIPNGTWVQIRKPEVSVEEWKDEWRTISWDHSYNGEEGMDKYNNTMHHITRHVNHEIETYKLNDTEGYTWHRDWFVIIDIDKNGNPIPIDNQGRKNCYWCEEKTKTKSVNFEYESNRKYTYCPKCSR
jgi:hypothetical protein